MSKIYRDYENLQRNKKRIIKCKLLIRRYLTSFVSRPKFHSSLERFERSIWINLRRAHRLRRAAHHHSSLLFTVTIRDRNREKGWKPLPTHSWLPMSTAADEAIKFHTIASRTRLFHRRSFRGASSWFSFPSFPSPLLNRFWSTWSWIATWRDVPPRDAALFSTSFDVNFSKTCLVNSHLSRYYHLARSGIVGN